MKITAKFRASRRLRFEDTKRIVSPEIRPKSFGTFEKQAPEPVSWGGGGGGREGKGAILKTEPVLIYPFFRRQSFGYLYITMEFNTAGLAKTIFTRSPERLLDLGLTKYCTLNNTETFFTTLRNLKFMCPFPKLVERTDITNLRFTIRFLYSYRLITSLKRTRASNTWGLFLESPETFRVYFG